MKYSCKFKAVKYLWENKAFPNNGYILRASWYVGGGGQKACSVLKFYDATEG